MSISMVQHQGRATDTAVGVPTDFGPLEVLVVLKGSKSSVTPRAQARTSKHMHSSILIAFRRHPQQKEELWCLTKYCEWTKSNPFAPLLETTVETVACWYLQANHQTLGLNWGRRFCPSTVSQEILCSGMTQSTGCRFFRDVPCG